MTDHAHDHENAVPIAGETQPPPQCPGCDAQLAVSMANQVPHYAVDIAECDETVYQMTNHQGEPYGDELHAYTVSDDSTISCRACSAVLVGSED